jgi:mRNA interferase MazF
LVAKTFTFADAAFAYANPVRGDVSPLQPMRSNAVFIQNDVGNRYSPLTIVAAITSTVSSVPYPVEVLVDPTAANGLDARSSIRLDQIRTVDRQRLVRCLGVVDSGTITSVDEAIKISLGLI